MEQAKTGRKIKRKLYDIFESPGWEENFRALASDPASKLISPLFSCLYNPSKLIKWHGISAFGIYTGMIINTLPGKVNELIRKCIWMLTEESGGIAWGAPEVIGEVIANNEKLTERFLGILVSYLHEPEGGTDNYLEFTPLRKGAFWGFLRVSQEFPHLASGYEDIMLQRFNLETDPYILACLLLIFDNINSSKAVTYLTDLFDNGEEIEIYYAGKFTNTLLGSLAQNIYKKLSAAG